MKKIIDVLIINNCPSFYKINLYNELAKQVKLHVVFIGLTNQVVINNCFEDDIHFSFELISNVQIEKRNKIKSLIRLYFICKHYDYKKIIYGGYADFEEKVLMWITKKSKNCLQFESSIRESRVTGIVAYLKKIIFARFIIALPAGKLQSAVFYSLGYKGVIIESKGVGLFNNSNLKKSKTNVISDELKYLFVGRLIPVKNIELLIRVFNNLNKHLTIVGTGVLENKLRAQANSNIEFTGFILNNELDKLYCSHDVFILPSISETWGLVVEEAIYFGLPVIVSDAVGCQEDMVLEPDTGVVFRNSDENDLVNAILKLETNIETYKQNCIAFDFQQRDKMQISAYLNILNI